MLRIVFTIVECSVAAFNNRKAKASKLGRHLGGRKWTLPG
jgi:hypothetical protein